MSFLKISPAKGWTASRLCSKQITALFLALSMALSGCVTTSSANDPNLTPEENRLRQQAADFNQTVVEGAVLGALVGALLMAMASDDQDRGKNAAKGAAIGGILGASAGYYVGKQKENYATEQSRLDSMIADVEADDVRLQQMLETTEKVIAKNKIDLRNASQKLESGQISLEEAKAQHRRSESNHKVITNSLEGMRKKHEGYVNASVKHRGTTGQDTSEMDAKIAGLETSIAELEQSAIELADALDTYQISG